MSGHFFIHCAEHMLGTFFLILHSSRILFFYCFFNNFLSSFSSIFPLFMFIRSWNSRIDPLYVNVSLSYIEYERKYFLFDLFLIFVLKIL